MVFREVWASPGLAQTRTPGGGGGFPRLVCWDCGSAQARPHKRLVPPGLQRRPPLEPWFLGHDRWGSPPLLTALVSLSRRRRSLEGGSLEWGCVSCDDGPLWASLEQMWSL